MTTTIEGYIIANRGWEPDTKLAMGKGSFAKTAGEAWRRHIRPPHNSGPDFSIIVQRWSDKGYGPHRARMELIEE